ncbi:sugar O-acetyltransferase [Haloferula sp.]|uniref:sugar O-acetyltransferase n=1 Tax=Haloferula sp. TaxID=2497595 RepID=UPI003C70B91F
MEFDCESEALRMLGGELYNPLDSELVRLRARASRMLARLGKESDGDKLIAGWQELFGEFGKNSIIRFPFICDYGLNIFVGDSVFLNIGCVVLDCARVEIGSYTWIGPNVGIYTASHPLDWKLRREKQSALPISIGSDVWIGGGSIILPGVSVGDRSVIGAGSVVTKSVPEGVVAAGNPCRVLRPLDT